EAPPTAAPLTAAPMAEGTADSALPAPAEPMPPVAGEAEDGVPNDLPPIDSLTLDSDFTPFLRAGVPEDLHRQALRKLWTSDPVFANDDGLKDYAGDYSAMFNLSEPVKTLYRVGRGFLDAAEEAEEQAREQAAAASEGRNQDACDPAEEAEDQPKGDVPNQA
ncbi:MAG TPA: DUF3306 domain-containing protein, partial [Azospirillum sp.]